MVNESIEKEIAFKSVMWMQIEWDVIGWVSLQRCC